MLKKLKGAKVEPEEPLEPSFDEKLDILFTRYVRRGVEITT